MGTPSLPGHFCGSRSAYLLNCNIELNWVLLNRVGVQKYSAVQLYVTS